MRGTWLAVLLTAQSLLVACGSSQTSEGTTPASAEEAPLAQTSVDDVATAIAANDGSISVFDANHRETFDEHHVPGAKWVHYDDYAASELPADHASRLVFYCANEQCSASHVAARRAMELGYTNVSVMGAGIQGWIAAGKPVEASEQ